MEIKTLAILIGMMASPVLASPETTKIPCPYDPELLSFKGNAVSQASCLLREVLFWGHISSAPVVLPDVFVNRVGQKVGLTVPQLRRYLSAQQIKENDIGGSLDLPVSQAETHKTGQFPAKYFVVHDTSTPNLLKAPFPKDIDTETWKHNDVTVWQKGEKSKAHVFISRHGQSVTAMPFERGWRSTKFELTYNKRFPHVPDEEVRGRFLHIELVQPRRSAPVTDRNASEKKSKTVQLLQLPDLLFPSIVV